MEIIPKEFDIQAVTEKYQTAAIDDNCMNTVRIQEMNQYNQLLHCMKTTLKLVLDAVQGKTT